MNDAIIGGAIAAVIGVVGYAIVGLWLECYHEKNHQRTIVYELINETVENLTICANAERRKKPWLTPYRLDAWHAYKGQLFFLPEDVIARLASSAFAMQVFNTIIQAFQSKASIVQLFDEEPSLSSEYLIEQLEFVDKGLRKWRREHIRFVTRLHNFISKIRNNSKLSHS
jgi:hypothetical protein